MANKANACQFRAIGIGLLITALLWPAVVRPAVLFNPAGVSGQRFAAALSEVGDQNGDGRWELLSGSYMYSVGGAERGRLYLWFGGNSLALSADWTYEGQPAEWLGFAVARIGDVNNDGTDDFAAGAPLANNAGAEAGRVYIFFGGTPLPSSPDVILEGPTAGGHFGFSVSAAGDFNRDGRDDLIVGAPNYSLSGTERGAAYIYYGGSSIGSDPDLTVIGEIAGDHFGWSVTDCGNFTGTVENCVAVGAPHHTSAGLDAGAAYVFEGGSSPNTTPEHKFTNIGTAPLSEYGFVVRGLGRWDGDSYDDLAVAERRGTGVREVSSGETLRVGDTSLAVLWPDATVGDDWSENNSSVVLRGTVSGHGLLLTGDIERRAEDRLCPAPGALLAGVLKVPHHGSGTSSTNGFVRRVSPGLAVVQVGERNRYGHPNPETLERLEAAGAFVMRTDVDGAVVITFREGRATARCVASGRECVLQRTSAIEQ